ncbi:ribonuclease HII [uncultured Cardiobacterium sp.]|uniref:ribonuclease HII n=1 Tax=uncultured Cardiobacterium sp. TaxID=417619 RepID=UPI002603718B|nr:ribonuclease HII [uncultured Cardiobacterium sp.]
MVARVAGVDEAGRGALVGNVVAAAVILPETFNLPGLTDSKKLSARQREVLFDAITAQALAWCAAAASPAEIDAMNIHHATLLAMRRAVEGLATPPQSVLVDGKFTPELAMPARAIVGGDASEACIAAASIIAKVTRDRQMMELEARFPGYDFAAHKGYGTKAHLAALARLGATPEHRRSYAPVRAMMASGFLQQE